MLPYILITPITLKAYWFGAEMGMYAAKSGGGNRLEVCASPEPGRKRAEERLYWELKIDEALRNDGLTLYWQPVLDLRRSDVVGYELLLRMKERENHVIRPDASCRLQNARISFPPSIVGLCGVPFNICLLFSA